jgi:hypothetical protein
MLMPSINRFPFPAMTGIMVKWMARQSPSNDGVFRYYNSFKCPSCLTPFIDFEKYREIRTQEYYGNVHINEKPRYLKDNDLVT